MPNLPITDAPWRANSVLLVRKNGSSYVTIIEISPGAEGNPIWNFWRFTKRNPDSYLKQYREEKEQRLQSGGTADPSYSSPSLETSGKPESRFSGSQTEAPSSEIDNTAAAGKVKPAPEPAAAQSSEKLAKFEAAPKAEVTGEEIFSSNEPLPVLSQIRDRVIDWLNKRGWIKDFPNTDSGWDINVSRKSIRDAVFHGSDMWKTQSFAALPDILKHGIYLEPGKVLPNGIQRHIFAAKLNIGDEKLVVGFVVEEHKNGKRFYNHELTEIRNLDRPILARQPDGIGSLESGRDSVMDIVRKHLSVNPGMTPNSGNRGPAPIAEKKAPDKLQGKQTRSGAILVEPKPRPPGPVEINIYLDRSNSPEKTPK